MTVDYHAIKAVVVLVLLSEPALALLLWSSLMKSYSSAGADGRVFTIARISFPVSMRISSGWTNFDLLACGRRGWQCPYINAF